MAEKAQSEVGMVTSRERGNPIMLLLGNDTLQSVGIFIEHCYGAFTKDQRAEIETAILSLTKGYTGEELNFRILRQNRLLGCIPIELIERKDAAELRTNLEAEDDIPPNEPLVRFSSSSHAYTEEEFFKERGVEVKSPANSRLRELYQPLEKWRATNKDESQIDILLPLAVSLKEALAQGSPADEPVKQAAWTHLASFASEAVIGTTAFDSERFKILKSIVIEAAYHEDPKPNEKYDQEWDHPSWSPAPRNEAAQALSWLASVTGDQQTIAAIEKLVEDPVPSVRFLLACELWRLQTLPEIMWRNLNRLGRDANAVVLQGVTVSLWRLLPRWPDESLVLIKSLLERTKEDGEAEDKARGHLISMVVDFAVCNSNAWAVRQLKGWQANALTSTDTIAISGRRLIEYIQPQTQSNYLQAARRLLLQHIDAVTSVLPQLRKMHGELKKEDYERQWKGLYGVVDETIMRISFAADVNPNLQKNEKDALDDTKRKQFLAEILPILERVISFGKQPETGMLLAPTANHFMELLNGMLKYNPSLVLRMAAEVVNSSKRFSYNLDAIAMGEVVKLVQSILVDYRDEVRDAQSINNLLELLDAFVEAGWPEALNLVWRLDEIFR